MKTLKLDALLTGIFMILPEYVIAAHTCQTGELNQTCWECGLNCTARLDLSTGKLSVNGEGPMKNYSWGGNEPWKSKNDKIISLEVNGVSTIGNGAFFGLTKLQNVQIGKSVETIEIDAFNRASNVSNIVFEEGSRLIEIKQGAFYLTDNLHKLTLPENLQTLERWMFSTQDKLQELTISDQTKLSPETFSSDVGSWRTVLSSLTIKCAGNIEQCKENLINAGYSLDSFKSISQASYKRTDESGVTRIFDENGKLIGLQGKRILTVDEAAALVKNNKNTFKLKYR